MVALHLTSPPLIETDAAKGQSPDLVRMIEAAYSFEATDGVWLHRIVSTASGVLHQGHGIAGWFFRVSPDLKSKEVSDAIFLGCPAGFAEACREATLAVESQVVAEQYVYGPPCTSLTRLIEHTATQAANVIKERCGISDGRMLRADFGPFEGAMIVVPTASCSPFPPRLRPLLGCVGAHIAAAKRLRDAVRSGASSEQTQRPPPIDFDAILDERARLLHAEPQAQSKAHRSALGQAVADLVRSRGPLRRRDPATAIELWRALVAGRWSLVHHVDSDGRRMLLARRNPPFVKDPRAVSTAERRVLSLVARGHPMKLVAYELGITASTASQHLANGLRKLGLRTRLELVNLLCPGVAQASEKSSRS